MARKKPRPTPLIIEYCAHELARSPRMRARRNDWAPDAFEILTPKKFDQLQEFCVMFGIPMSNLDVQPK